MPKLNKGQVYGVDIVNNALTFRDRLMERFQPHEYVRVINVDNEPVYWQYLPAHKEQVTFTADPMKITTRGEPEPYMLNPGETEVLIGENAYIMIEVLYKQIVAKKTVERSPDVAPGQARNFNFSDAGRQEELINKIYLGKETPNFGYHDPEEEEKDEEKPRTDKARAAKRTRDLEQHLERQVA